MTVLRHSSTNLHLGVMVLLRCMTTQSTNILPKWNWASSSSGSNSVIPTCPKYIIHDASRSGSHILYSVHLAQITNVWDLNFTLWVEFDHLSWWYNPPMEQLRCRLCRHKYSTPVYAWRCLVESSRQSLWCSVVNEQTSCSPLVLDWWTAGRQAKKKEKGWHTWFFSLSGIKNKAE